MAEASSDKDQIFIAKLTEIILANLGDENYGAKELSDASGISHYLLSRRLYAITRKTINQFIRETRLRKALEILQNEELTASEVAYKVGFRSPTYFNTCFREYFGYPPGKIKKPEPCNANEVNYDPVKATKEQKRPAWRTFIIITSGILLFAVIVYLVYPVFIKNSFSVKDAPLKHLGNSISNKNGDDKTVKDIDGNIYHTLAIGKQIWMAEDLKSTKYNDGTPIPCITDDTLWAQLKSDGYCWFNNDESKKPVYGALYNWYTTNTAKLCPVDWHVSTNSDWITLIAYCGGWEVAGGKLKEAGTAHWKAPNIGATNNFGFTALPNGGRRCKGKLGFGLLGVDAAWWCPPRCGDLISMSSGRSWIYLTEFVASEGCAVRCVKNKQADK